MKTIQPQSPIAFDFPASAGDRDQAMKANQAAQVPACDQPGETTGTKTTAMKTIQPQSPIAFDSPASAGDRDQAMKASQAAQAPALNQSGETTGTETKAMKTIQAQNPIAFDSPASAGDRDQAMKASQAAQVPACDQPGETTGTETTAMKTTQTQNPIAFDSPASAGDRGHAMKASQAAQAPACQMSDESAREEPVACGPETNESPLSLPAIVQEVAGKLAKEGTAARGESGHQAPVMFILPKVSASRGKVGNPDGESETLSRRMPGERAEKKAEAIGMREEGSGSIAFVHPGMGGGGDKAMRPRREAKAPGCGLFDNAVQPRMAIMKPMKGEPGTACVAASPVGSCAESSGQAAGNQPCADEARSQHDSKAGEGMRPHEASGPEAKKPGSKAAAGSEGESAGGRDANSRGVRATASGAGNQAPHGAYRRKSKGKPMQTDQLRLNIKEVTVPWLKFPEGAARARWVVEPGGQAYIVIRTAREGEGEKVRELALRNGFTESSEEPELVCMPCAPGREDRDKAIERLHKDLGGKIIEIPESEFKTEEYTYRPPEGMPALSDLPKDASSQRGHVRIGVNMRDQEVFREPGGKRYFIKRHVKTGSGRRVFETAESRPVDFLRVVAATDFAAIAQGLVKTAKARQITKRDLAAAVDNALEPGEWTRPQITREEAEERLRKGMLQRISDMAYESAGDRSEFVAALATAESVSELLSRPSGGKRPICPGASLIAFLRRACKGNSVDFNGHEDLKIALPRLHQKDSPLQAHDLSEIPKRSLGEYALNILTRREPQGKTVFLSRGKADDPRNSGLRLEIARHYAFDLVAEATSECAEGAASGSACVLMFVGERRPQPLETPPQAALRTQAMSGADSMLRAAAEMSRSEGRIREWHDGLDQAELEDAEIREENNRQRPYEPLSKATAPFTMIPLALEGATRKAFRRVRQTLEGRGGIDAAVALSVGTTPQKLSEMLTAEQVDAVGMQMAAAERGRGFLIADQTGIGKGRSLAAIARAHARKGPGNKVMYLTESAQINVPDVCRDLQDVGAWDDLKVTFLTTGSSFQAEAVDPETGKRRGFQIDSLSPKDRAAVFQSGQWPRGCNVIISTYSQFSGKEEDARSVWIRSALDESTMLILDEAHNALNPASNTGQNFREAIRRCSPGNVVFSTATPARNPTGMNLYKPLLPQSEDESMTELLDGIASGGEVGQESFASMLAEDGVMLRRDHDLSSIQFSVNLPDDARMLEYQEVMDRFSPIVEGMINASTMIGELVNRNQALRYNEMLARGMGEAEARARTSEMMQYSLSIGAPLANLARITMNAIKIDQVVETAVRQIRERNKKPLITFHSTNEALLREITRLEDGSRMTPEEIRQIPPLTLRDQIRRIHRSIYRVRMDGAYHDARRMDLRVDELSKEIEQLIEMIPEELPVSPIDALVERLEAEGCRVGEISGRSLCYRLGLIQQREGRNRREIIDQFNNGDLDILIYNSAGATGASYHASPKFKDRRGRALIELETPVDIIKYVQSQGRGNRYGQVEKPRVISVMTGLTPEMRILQQRNGKLRSLGASVDGNRSHPLLLDDVPDFLNRVGDEATRNMLTSMPALARRLGFPEFSRDPSSLGNDGRNALGESDEGSGASKSPVESLANKVLARSIMLPATEQDDLVQRIRMEFDVLIEELESRNANPLRPKELEGRVEVRATTLYLGREREHDDLEISAFHSPLYISTGIHHFTEEAINADRLVSLIEQSVTVNGADGLQPYAERLRQNLATVLRPFLPDGADILDAMRDPEQQGQRFAARYRRANDMIWLLENLKPGVAVRFPSSDDLGAQTVRTIVDVVPPRDRSYYELPSAYKFRVVSPGMSRPETVSLARLMQLDFTRVYFRPGLSEGMVPEYLERFAREASLTRQLPVQILHGNILQAIAEAKRNELGTVSLYRDMDGQVYRGIVVRSSKTDLEKLPVSVSTGRVACELVKRFLAGRTPSRSIRFWGSMSQASDPGKRADADIIIFITLQTATIDMIPLRKSSAEFYRSRPGLYQALHNSDMPEDSNIPAKAFRTAGTNHKHIVRFALAQPHERKRLEQILSCLADVTLQTDGEFRTAANDIARRFDRELEPA